MLISSLISFPCVYYLYSQILTTWRRDEEGNEWKILLYYELIGKNHGRSVGCKASKGNVVFGSFKCYLYYELAFDQKIYFPGTYLSENLPKAHYFLIQLVLLILLQYLSLSHFLFSFLRPPALLSSHLKIFIHLIPPRIFSSHPHLSFSTSKSIHTHKDGSPP